LAVILREKRLKKRTRGRGGVRTRPVRVRRKKRRNIFKVRSKEQSAMALQYSCNSGIKHTWRGKPWSGVLPQRKKPNEGKHSEETKNPAADASEESKAPCQIWKKTTRLSSEKGIGESRKKKKGKEGTRALRSTTELHRWREDHLSLKAVKEKKGWDCYLGEQLSVNGACEEGGQRGRASDTAPRRR